MAIIVATVIALAALLFDRELAHSTGEGNQLACFGSADAGELDPRSSPSQSAGLALR
jgi:hypothetical protein